MSDLLSGFDDLTQELADLIRNVDNVQEVLVVGAEAYVDDLRKLGKPYSQIRKSGYTHMLDSISYKKAKNKEVEVGSTAAYHLRFVNDGTKASSKRKWSTPRQPFLHTTYNLNKNKYDKKMLKKLGLER